MNFSTFNVAAQKYLMNPELVAVQLVLMVSKVDSITSHLQLCSLIILPLTTKTPTTNNCYLLSLCYVPGTILTAQGHPTCKRKSQNLSLSVWFQIFLLTARQYYLQRTEQSNSPLPGTETSQGGLESIICPGDDVTGLSREAEWLALTFFCSSSKSKVTWLVFLFSSQ